MLHKFGSPHLRVTELYGLEPWSALQAGGRPGREHLRANVCSCAPFAESIRKQYAGRREISAVRDVLPDFDIATLIPPVTFAGKNDGRAGRKNLQALMAETARRQFDVALIGCGAYGLPLGAFVKQLGRKAVHSEEQRKSSSEYAEVDGTLGIRIDA